jgi:hypothetical protein
VEWAIWGVQGRAQYTAFNAKLLGAQQSLRITKYKAMHKNRLKQSSEMQSDQFKEFAVRLQKTKHSINAKLRNAKHSVINKIQ